MGHQCGYSTDTRPNDSPATELSVGEPRALEHYQQPGDASDRLEVVKSGAECRFGQLGPHR